jgi:hypothetical protein
MSLARHSPEFLDGIYYEPWESVQPPMACLYEATDEDWADYREHLDSLPEEERFGQCFPDEPEPWPEAGEQGSVLYRLPDGTPAVYKDGEGAR